MQSNQITHFQYCQRIKSTLFHGRNSSHIRQVINENNDSLASAKETACSP